MSITIKSNNHKIKESSRESLKTGQPDCTKLLKFRINPMPHHLVLYPLVTDRALSG